MNRRDPKLVALEFNECINNQDLAGLEALMTEDHAFVDGDGKIEQPRDVMILGWRKFFKMFPAYRNTIKRVESTENLVTMLGHAYWSEEQPYDPVIWTAIIENDLVREWRIYADSEENRKRFNLL